MARLRQIFNDVLSMNSAVLSGALDVVVIRHADGSLHCSPFHVRFGKLKLLVSKEKTITIAVNGEPTPINMKLGNEGEAYFVEETSEPIEEGLAASPILSPIDSPQMSAIEETASEERVIAIDPEEEESKQAVVAYHKRGSPPSTVKESPKPGVFSKFMGYFKKDAPPAEPQLELSLCGNSFTENFEQAFNLHRVTFEEFSADPWKVLHDPHLVVRFGQEVFDFQAAVPMLFKMLAFNKLPEQPSEPRDTQALTASPSRDSAASPPPLEIPKSGYKKTLVLESAQLEQLNLQPGANTVEYTVFSVVQGRQSISAMIYLWDVTSKIVISDIDGTITRSDFLGQVMPIMGKDWSHPGVVDLYNSIYANGYKIIYLSSRAIGQIGTTKGYLTSLTQNARGLPEGPVIMSPDRLVTSFIRECIKREPHKLKAKVLRDVSSLFPEDRQPFYAGFGNRPTDFVAYRAGGVSDHKIFIIDPTGTIRLFNSTYTKSYRQIDELVEEMFPTIHDRDTADSKFLALNYWKAPVLNLAVMDDLE